MRTANPSTSLRRWTAAALLLSCLAALSTGCATTQEVKKIVDGSNAALLSQTRLSQTRLLTDSPLPSGQTGSWQAEVARIEAFISANTDQPVTVNALRLRQALILTVFKQDNLALAAFDLIDGTALRTDRDKALHALRQHLVWWFKLDGETMKGDATSADLEKCGDFCKARTALADFSEACGGLPQGEGMRYWLEEMRAWIAVQLAQELPRALETEADGILGTSLDRFAAQFTADDLKWVEVSAAESHAAAELPIPVLRFRLRARAVVDEYRKAKEDLNPDWSNEQTQALLAAIRSS